MNNTLPEARKAIKDALALHNRSASREAIETAAYKVMMAEDDFYWSAALFATDADLRLLAVARRRQALDNAMEPLFS